MARPGVPNGKCTVCNSPHRLVLDQRFAEGAALAPLAKKYGVGIFSLRRHTQAHISKEWIASVRIGPFGSEEQLRKLCAESGASVLETLQAVRGGILSRWLANLEAGADHNLVLLTGKVHESISLQARITGELMPAGPSSVTVNNYMLQDPATLRFVGRLMGLVRKYPEIRTDLAALVRESFAEATPALTGPEVADAA